MSYVKTAHAVRRTVVVHLLVRCSRTSGPPAPRRVACVKRRKTVAVAVLAAELWVRTPSIGRTGMSIPVDEVARSAAADSACLGSGSTSRHRFTACIGRLSVVADTGCARRLWQLATVCWAEVLPVTAAEAGRALGPMLPASAREPCPFCVVRDSCHAAVPDQPGLPSIGSGRRTGRSRCCARLRTQRPRPLPLPT